MERMNGITFFEVLYFIGFVMKVGDQNLIDTGELCK
jgi:hypothetical protein